MAEVTRIEGLAEFRRALRAMPDTSARAMSTALRKAMDPIAREAKRYTAGQIARAIKPFSRGLNAGIRSAHPGAGVHEFADGLFFRRPPGGGPKNVLVDWTDPTPTPRYAYRAAEEEMPEVEDRVLEAIAKVARDTGWL